MLQFIYTILGGITLENERIFELLEKMYSDISNRFDKVENNLESIKNELNEVKDKTKKNSINNEDIKKNIKVLAEVQQNHYEQNQRNHEEIVEMLSEKVSTVEKAVVNNFKAIK